MPELRPYQLAAVDFLHKKERALIAYPPGTGKTATITRWLYEDEIGRTLIVCPVAVLTHWHDQILQWTPVTDRVLTVGIYRGVPKHRAEILDFIIGAPDPSFLIVSYETFRNDIERLKQVRWDAVVFDESHRLKNRRGISFKAAGQLARSTPRLALLTGTPIINRAEELWTSMSLLEPANYRAFWRWAEHYFRVELVRRRRRLVREVGDVRPERLNSLHTAVDQRVLSRPIEELLPDLPDVSETNIEIELSSAERKAYDQMDKDLWMSVGGNLTVALNAAVKQARLRQLASDWSAFDPDARLGSKGKAAIQLVEDLDGEQCVIFCAYRQTVEALCEHMPNAVPIHGGVPQVARGLFLDDFKSGRARVLVGTLNTIGEGVDGLQCARNAIFIDRAWTPAAMEQAIGRLRRQGQRSNVNVLHVIARDTVDGVIAAALRRKEEVIDAILRNKSVSR